MSDAPTPDLNPYSAPTGLEDAADIGLLSGTSAGFPQSRRLSHWQLFFAICCFLLFGLGSLSFGSVFLVSGLLSANGFAGSGMSFSWCLMGLFLLLYLLVGMLLLRASAAAKRFANAPDSATLTSMLASQLLLWRIIGLLTLIGLAIWVLAVVVAARFM